MPRLRKRGKSGYYYACFYDGKRSPKEKNVPLKTNRKDIATRKYSKLVDRYELEWYDPWTDSGTPRSLSVRAAADDFMVCRNHLRPESREAYSFALRGVVAKLPPGVRLIDIRASHLRDYIHDGGVSPARAGSSSGVSRSPSCRRYWATPACR
jgi:hypothetical protein